MKGRDFQQQSQPQPVRLPYFKRVVVISLFVKLPGDVMLNGAEDDVQAGNQISTD